MSLQFQNPDRWIIIKSTDNICAYKTPILDKDNQVVKEHKWTLIIQMVKEFNRK
jgi:hypothetical protein